MLEDYFSSLLHKQSEMLFASDRQYINFLPFKMADVSGLLDTVHKL